MGNTNLFWETDGADGSKWKCGVAGTTWLDASSQGFYFVLVALDFVKVCVILRRVLHERLDLGV